MQTKPDLKQIKNAANILTKTKYKWKHNHSTSNNSYAAFLYSSFFFANTFFILNSVLFACAKLFSKRTKKEMRILCGNDVQAKQFDIHL